MKNKSKVLLMLPGAVEALQSRDVKTLSVLSENNMKINRETYVRTIGNTAIVSVAGALLNHLSYVEYLMGYNSYEFIMQDLRAVMADDNVEQVVLDFDSPGGSSSEMFEMAAYIRKMDATKPIYGWVGSMACSAAYGLASACKKIYANPAAEIGSVGTMIVASHQEEPDGDGIKYIQIVASDSPLKNADPTTPEGVQSHLDRVNAINSQFVEMLAANRGVTTDYVKSNFGRGAVFSGREALDRKMIDGTFATFDEFISFLTKDQGGNTMNGDDTKALDTAPVVADEPAVVVATEDAPVDTPATEQPIAESVDEIRAAAIADERARVAELSELAATADASASVLANAIASGKSADEFSKDLVALRETTNVTNNRASIEQSREESHAKNVDNFAARL